MTLVITFIQHSTTLRRYLIVLFLVSLGCSPDQEQQAKSSAPPGEEKNIYQPLVNSLGDTIPTGVEILVSSKALSVEEVMDVTVVPVGDPEIIPAHPNVVELNNSTSTILHIDLESLPKLSAGDIANPLPLLNSLGDTIPTGIPLPANGRRVVAKWPEPLPASLPRYLDKATVDIKFLDVEHGMSSPFVESMLKDSRGYFWFGTYGGGVNMYDGKTIRHFKLPHGLSSIIVNHMIEDSEGRIWFASQNGLGYYDGYDFIQFDEGASNANNRINCLLEDNDGNIWFGSSKYGLSKFDGLSFTHYTEKEGCKAKSIASLVKDRDGNIWIGDTEQGLIKFDGTSFTYMCEKGGLPRIHYTTIHEDTQGNLWLGTKEDGIFIYDGNQITQLIAEFNSPVRAIKEDHHGNIWFGIQYIGLFMYDGNCLTRIGEEQGLNNSVIQDILIDDLGKVWLATYGGISVYDPYTFKHPKVLSDMVFTCIFKDSRGNMWFGTRRNGVFKYDGQHYFHFSEEQGFGNKNVQIRAITEDHMGNIWFGAKSYGTKNYSLVKYDGQLKQTFLPGKGASFTYYNFKGLNLVEILLEDKYHNLWIGYEEGALLRFDGKTLYEFTASEDWIGGSVFNGMIEDHQGNVWVNTKQGGVTKIDPVINSNGSFSFTHFSEREGLTNGAIASILPDRQGNLWIKDFYGNIFINRGGTGSGDKKMFTRFDLGQVKEGKYVQTIMQDQDSRLWFCLTGISGLDILFLDTAEYSIPAFSYTFGIQDGLKSLSNFSPLLDNDRIWFITNKGISQLDLNRFQEPTPSTEMYLNEIEINGLYYDYRNLTDSIAEEVEFDSVYRFSNIPSNLRLPYNLNNLNFHFSALDWLAPHQVSYSYFLEGISREWSALDKGTNISFQRLSHGEYTLRIRAVGKSNQWSDTLSYSFVIYPPWWHTWWARMLYGIVVVGLVVGIVRQRTTLLKKNQKKLEQMINERTKELKQSQSQLIQSEKMASLGQLTAGIAHEINNPVSFTRISSFALDKDLKYISKLIKKYRSYIQNIKQDKSEIEEFEKSIDYHTLLKAINQEISDIKEGTKRTSEIVKSLREFSHESHEEMEPADIHQGIDTTLNLLKSRFNEQIILTKNYDQSIGLIKCHIAQLNQVFINLLANALDAIEEKGEIVITTKNQENNLMISIKNNGKRIPEEDINMIFDPFFTTKKIGQGTGLGLSISYRIIDDHGGTISVVSNQKKETRFDIVLPFIK